LLGDEYDSMQLRTLQVHSFASFMQQHFLKFTVYTGPTQRYEKLKSELRTREMGKEATVPFCDIYEHLAGQTENNHGTPFGRMADLRPVSI
jgi:hypothetical protein